MSLELIAVVALTLAVVLRFLVLPALRRAAGETRAPSIAQVAFLGALDALALAALLIGVSALALSLALLGLQFWAQSQTQVISLTQFDRAIGLLRQTFAFAQGAQNLGGGVQLIVLIAALIFVGWRTRRMQAVRMLQKEAQAGVDALMTQMNQTGFESIQAGPRGDDIKLRLQRLQGELAQAAAANGGRVPETDNWKVREFDQMARTLLLVALDHDGRLRIDASALEPPPPQTLPGRVGAFFLSRGLIDSMGRLTRTAFLAGALLVVPASLVAVGAGPASERVAESLNDVEGFAVQLDRQEAERALFAAAEAAAEAEAEVAREAEASTPAALETAELTDLNASDWCESDDARCDEIVVSRLAQAFEAAYARGLLQQANVTLHEASAVERPLVRHAILAASERRNTAPGVAGFRGGAPTPPPPVATEAPVLTETAIDLSEAALSNRVESASIREDARALDIENSTPVRDRFKAFLRTEFIERRPDAWRALRRMASAHAAAFQAIPSQRYLGEQLAIRAAGFGLNGAAIDAESALSAAVNAEALEMRPVDLQMRRYVHALLSNGGDPSAAAGQMRGPSPRGGGFTTAETAEFQRLSARIGAAVDASVGELDARPATLARSSIGATDPTRVAEAIETYRLRNNRTVSVAAYDTLFSNEGAVVDERGVRRSASRSFAQMNSFHRVGGIVFGRPADNADSALDFRDIAWRRSGETMSLALTRADGEQVEIAGFDPEIVHLALAYAADGRRTAVTITGLETGDQQVLLHPVFEDTALGCRLIAFDHYVFDLLPDAEMAPVTAASEQTIVYNYAVARRLIAAQTVLTAQGLSLNEDTVAASQTHVQQVAQLPGLPEAIANSVQNAALLRAKPDYYHAELVATIGRCAANPALAQFDACLDRQATREVERALATSPEGRQDAFARVIPAGTTEMHTPSGVRDVAWRFDPALAFARHDATAPPNGFESFIQAAFETPPYFRASLQNAPDSERASLFRAAYDADPYRFPVLQPRIRTVVGEYVVSTRGRDEVEPIAQLVRLNRLFTAALEGDLGTQFPIRKLATLARLTAVDVTVSPTPRWNAARADAEEDPTRTALRTTLQIPAYDIATRLGPEGQARCPAM